MKILSIKSNFTDKTVAEIRVVKDQVQVVVDKTNGTIEKMFASGFSNGQNLINHSAALRLEPGDTKGVKVYRYLLTNGDMVQISTDGKTVALNGSLLDEEYKQRLLQALSSQQLKVAKKSGGVDPSVFYQPKPVDMIEQEHRKMMHLKIQEQEAKIQELSDPPVKRSKASDPVLDDFAEQQDHDHGFYKALAYKLHYGDKK